MFQLDQSVMKKNLILSSIGMTLQVIGSICLFIATLGIVKNINLQIKNALIKELSKNIDNE